MDTKKQQKLLGIWLSYLFNWLVMIINVAISVTLFFGAIASLILLLKLVPEQAIILLPALFNIFLILWTLVKIIGTLIIFFLVSLMGIKFFEYLEDLRGKRKKAREKFLNDLAKKLNCKCKKK